MIESKRIEKFPHSSIVESHSVGKFALTTDMCPWLKTDVLISVSEISFDDGHKILIASHIPEGLQKIARSAREKHAGRIDHATYELVRKIASGEFTNLPRIKSPIKNDLRIYYHQGRETRVYVLHLGANEHSLNNQSDLVIRVAICLKNSELNVLRQISKFTKT